MTLRIATWNVESIRAHEAQVLGWIERHDIDLLCMQETRANVRRFPRNGFEALGYDLEMCGGDEGRAGVAVAARCDVADVTSGIPGAVAPLHELRSISLTVDDTRIHTCYAPNGRKVGTRHHDIKLAWFALFSSWIALDREPDSDLIVLGDLNIAPTDADVWDASRYRKRNLTSPPERQAFTDLLAAADLVDVARAHFGDQRAFTWWNRRSDFYETDRGWRLDHVLASPGAAKRIELLEIDRLERGRPGSTDHAPIRFELDDRSA